MVPLQLATIAALTPDGYRVDIWDELVEGPLQLDSAVGYDLIGMTSFGGTLSRNLELALALRARGIRVVVGGPGVSAEPEACRGVFDTIFIGEAERTWPRFLADWERGEARAEYRQIEKLDLTDTPRPRFEPLGEKVRRYRVGAFQTTRGCPFDCEFCDVIYLFGRRQRHKPVDRVIDEVREQQRLGFTTLFVADDEFVADKTYTKELLRALIAVNDGSPEPLSYFTQCSLNAAKDAELLELLTDCNFTRVLIGLESPSTAALLETNKRHNLRPDLVSEVHRILSYGIGIKGTFILGFDADGPETFDEHLRFYRASFVPSVQIYPLQANNGTRLWRRMMQEGRLLDIRRAFDAELGPGHVPLMLGNIMPKRMSRRELLEGYRRVIDEVARWESLRERLCGWVSLVSREPRVSERQPSADELLGLARRLGAGDEHLSVVGDIIDHTQTVAPFMMKRVATFVAMHQDGRNSWEGIVRACEAALAVERKVDWKKLEVTIELRMPAAFVAGFEGLFGPAFDRVFRNLAARDELAEALVQVFVDFLTRLGAGFAAVDEHHPSLVEELCDRVCAERNGIPPEQFVPVEDGAVPSWRAIRLHEAVLKGVGDELVRVRGDSKLSRERADATA